MKLKEKTKKILLSLSILVLNLIFCIIMINYNNTINSKYIKILTLQEIEKNVKLDYESGKALSNIPLTIRIDSNNTFKSSDIGMSNIDGISQYNNKYIRIENLEVDDLVYYDRKDYESSIQSPIKSNNIKIFDIISKALTFDKKQGNNINNNTDILANFLLNDKDKTLKHQLRKGDKITIEGKLEKCEDGGSSGDGMCSKHYNMVCNFYLQDFKIINIDTSNENKQRPPSPPNENTNISDTLNIEVSKIDNWKKGNVLTVDNMKNLYSKYHQKEDRTIALTLSPKDIAEDEKLNFEKLSKYGGQYIRIENYEVDRLVNDFDWTNDDNKLMNIYLHSELEKTKKRLDFNEFPYIYINFQMDYTDNTTLNYTLNKGDKITIEGKLERKYNMCDNTIDSLNRTGFKLIDCRIIK